MYDIETLYQAKDVGDAVEALKKNPNAVLISGGTDVLIQIREGKLAGASLVSLHNIKELKGIQVEEDQTIWIGPASSFSRIANDPVILDKIPILAEVVDTVRGPQIRNMGTIGGNVCNGVTSADSASTQFVLNASLELTGPSGIRHVPISEFYTGSGRTVRSHEEVLTGIRIAREDYEGYFGCYVKYGKRKAMEIATLGCAVLVKVTEDKKRIEDLRIAFGVAAPTPIRCYKTEEGAKGMEIGNDLLCFVAEGVQGEVNPRSSWRASKEFRLLLIQEMAKRGLAKALERAGADVKGLKYWENWQNGGEIDA